MKKFNDPIENLAKMEYASEKDKKAGEAMRAVWFVVLGVSLLLSFGTWVAKFF